MSSRRRSTLTVLAAVVLVISACSSPEGGTPAESEPGATGGTGASETQDRAAPPAELEEFYQQQLNWGDCETGVDEYMRCASLTVPLDYEDPQGTQIELALITSSAEDRPYLLTNPGGPGQSGVDTVAHNLSATVTPEVLDEFNIVGFDPRGVHRSTPVVCMDDAQMDAYRQEVGDTDLDDDAAYATAFADAERIAEQCYEHSGELLGHVDTFSAAKDMDIMRAVLGQDELHYVGFSYGTKLGLAYAELFPEYVGRFVLDSVMDVSLDAHELAVTQTAGFESALESFADWCAESDQCPVEGEAEDVVTGVQGVFADVQQNPRTMPDGRLLNASTLVSGFITPLYHPQGWGPLRDGLTAAVTEEDFYAFQYWADLQAGRAPDGSYEWINTWAFRAVMCLDYPTAQTQEEIEAELQDLNERAPTFGPYMGHDGVLCSQWPYPPVNEPWEPELPEVEQVLLLSTTGDPATPVAWAEDMHLQIPASSLLVSDAEGHIAYRPGNSCVTEVVDEYLISGELFQGRQDC